MSLKATFYVCGIMMTLGLGMFAFIPEAWAMCLGSSFATASRLMSGKSIIHESGAEKT